MKPYKSTTSNYLPFKDYTDTSNRTTIVDGTGCSDCMVNLVKNTKFVYSPKKAKINKPDKENTENDIE